MIINRLVTIIFWILMVVDGGNIYPQINNGRDITCGDASKTDHCIINCNTNLASISILNCSNAGTCSIHCSAFKCLSSTLIYATAATNLNFTSTAQQCVEHAHIYLPTNGNATIVGDTQSTSTQVMKHFHIHSSHDAITASSTDRIYVECTDRSNDSDIGQECYALSINASVARYLEIRITGAEYNGHSSVSTDYAQVVCPLNSDLSPSCVLHASEACSTTNLKIYTKYGMPHDLQFVGDYSGDYTGTLVLCDDGQSIIKNRDAHTNFIGDCYSSLIAQMATTSSSCANCIDDANEESDIKIVLAYTFTEDIVYILKNMNCFLYEIFSEWFEKYQFVNTFSVCDIYVGNVSGGMHDDSVALCTSAPCIKRNAAQARRLLQDNEGTIIHTVASIIAYDVNTYKLILHLALDTMEAELEQHHVDAFGIITDAEVNVILHNADDKLLPQSTPPAFVFVILGISVLCFCVCGLLLCCRARIRRKVKKKTYEGNEGKFSFDDTGKQQPSWSPKHTTAPIKFTSGKKAVYAAGDGMETTTNTMSIRSPDFGVYAKHSLTTAKPQNLQPHGEEMMTQNLIFGDPKLKANFSESEVPRNVANKAQAGSPPSLLLVHNNNNNRVPESLVVGSPESLLMGQATYLGDNDDNNGVLMAAVGSPQSLLMGKGTYLDTDNGLLSQENNQQAGPWMNYKNSNKGNQVNTQSDSSEDDDKHRIRLTRRHISDTYATDITSPTKSKVSMSGFND